MFNRTYGYILRHPATRKYYWGPWLHRRRYEKVLGSLLKLCGGEKTTILDLGCGTGTYARYLETKSCGCHYVGCDIDAELLRLAYRGSSGNYVQCDIQLLPFKERSLDIVLCSEVLEHLSRPYEALTNLGRAAHQAVVITFPVERFLSRIKDRHPQHVSQIDEKRVTHLLVSLGFSLRQSRPIFSSFIPSGMLEFLHVPRNSFTESCLEIVERILKRIVPSSFVPHRTILVEGERAALG